MSVSDIRKYTTIPSALLTPIPCLPVFWFFIAASLPVSLPHFGYTSIPWAVAIGVVMIGTGFYCLPRKHWKRAWAVVPALAITLLHMWAPWQTYRTAMVTEERFVEIRGIVTEDRLPAADTLDWLEQPRQVEVKVTHIRLAGDWQACGGKVMLREFPAGVEYGQHIRAAGIFRMPWESILPGPMDYRNYLQVRGITHILYAEESEIISDASGWRRGVSAFFALRDQALERIVEGMDNESDRAILAAMTLGFRQSITPDDRDVYLRSGMLHLFAISGLHVGILFSLLILVLLLCRVPFSTRYFIAPALLLVYVVATGGAPSAVRAWLMLTVWSVGRGLKLPMVTTNVVLFAATALLILNPFYIYHSGYQFSFIIVLALIWGWRRGQFLVNYLLEKRIWVPIRAQNPNSVADRVRTVLLKCFISMAAAWLGGIGLTAFYNNLFLPAGIPTNMTVCLLAWPIILLSVMKLVLSLVFLGWAAGALGWLLHWPLAALRELAALSATDGGVTAIATPAVWTLGVYYILMFGFFLAIPRLKASFIMAVVLALFTTFMCGRYHLYGQRPVVTALVPGHEIHPVFLVCQPGSDPLLIGSGKKRFSYQLGAWLRHQGVGRLECVLLLDNRAAHTGGTEMLVQAIEIGTVHLSAHDWRHTAAVLDAQVRAGGRARVYDGDVRWQNVTVRKTLGDVEAYSCELRNRDWTLEIEMTIVPKQKTMITLSRQFSDGRREEITRKYFESERVEVEEFWAVRHSSRTSSD